MHLLFQIYVYTLLDSFLYKNTSYIYFFLALYMLCYIKRKLICKVTIIAVKCKGIKSTLFHSEMWWGKKSNMNGNIQVKYKYPT